MSTDTCRRIQVTRPGYMLTVSRRHQLFIYVTVDLYPATDGRQTWRQFRFVADTRNNVDAVTATIVDTTCIRQHVSRCKRGIVYYVLCIMLNAI